MSEGILDGVRVIEGSAFVAAPTAGMTLAQLGADVIRFDAPGGGLDWKRWPLTSDGDSLFWSGLQKGKRSIEIDLRSEEGREQLSQLITMPGPGNGIFMTNFPARGWMSYEKLSERREDLIMVVMTGNHDGSSEVDYTVNPSVGFPEAMGPRDSAVPTNSLMPAWDTAMGGLAVVGLLAALRHRDLTGEGQLVEIALERRRHGDGRQPRPDRRGPARGPRAAARRQLPLRRVRRRLPDRRRPPRHGRRADRPAVEGAEGGDRHRGALRHGLPPRPATTSAARPGATRAATSSASC